MTQKIFITILNLILLAMPIFAASHSEAPLISMDKYADNTDTYAFRSIEPGREGFVTLIANYIPLQEPSGAPQYFRFDDTVLYEIKIDNTGDGIEDVTYQFQFKTHTVNSKTILGMSTLNEDAVISNLDDPDYNQFQTYTVTRIDRFSGKRGRLIASGLKTPPSNIGSRTTPNYENNLGLPAVNNLSNGGKVFAGQRDDYFFIDLGGIFDTINLRSIGASGGVDTTQGFNISAIAIEVPIEEVTRSNRIPSSATASDAVIGVWATAIRQSFRVLRADNERLNLGSWQQVSRLGNPLFNEVLVPLGAKDSFNARSPKDDEIFASAVANPELPQLMRAIFGIEVPPAPRNDLISIFSTGIPVNPITGPNYTTFLSDGRPHDYLRLNVAIPATPFGSINRLGLLGGDVAGFPNGRRVHDDIVDIALRAAAGGTPLTPDTNVFPNNSLGDGVSQNPEGPLMQRFPYLREPNPGNTPRTSNQTFSNGREVSSIPTVNKNGNFSLGK